LTTLTSLIGYMALKLTGRRHKPNDTPPFFYDDSTRERIEARPFTLPNLQISDNGLCESE